MAVSCAIVIVPERVAAQSTTTDSRGFISVNAGLQAASSDFSDNSSFVLYVEEGDGNVDYERRSAPMFDVSAGAMVWRNLAIGGGVSVFSKDSTAQVSARLPHPFFFDQHRDVSGTGEGLARSERAFHVQVMWVAPVNDRLSVTVFGGPTFFSVDQDLVDEFTFAEVFPFDTAQFAGVSIVRASESTVGFNVGVDVGFYFSPHVGVGGLVRFSGGSVDFTVPNSEPFSSDVGGLSTAGGLRVRF